MLRRGRRGRRPGGGRCSPPVAPGDFPDPFLLAVPGGWVAYATNAPGRGNVQVRTSPDLRRWADGADALPTLPSWARPGRTWSPAVLAARGQWVLWYVAWHAASGLQALSVARAGSPRGPFTDGSSGPAILQRELGGSIDPSVMVDADGAAYLFWKADANAIGAPSSIWGGRLSPDGTALDGPPRQLLGHDRRWEAPLIEAPSVLPRPGGGYAMLYSAGDWAGAGYAIGWAAAEDPLGPWEKRSRHEPWVASDSDAAGPGGQEVATEPDGTTVMAYHAWDPRRVGYRSGGERSLRLGRLSWRGGQPELERLGPSSG